MLRFGRRTAVIEAAEHNHTTHITCDTTMHTTHTTNIICDTTHTTDCFFSPTTFVDCYDILVFKRRGALAARLVSLQGP